MQPITMKTFSSLFCRKQKTILIKLKLTFISFERNKWNHTFSLCASCDKCRKAGLNQSSTIYWPIISIYIKNQTLFLKSTENTVLRKTPVIVTCKPLIGSWPVGHAHLDHCGKPFRKFFRYRQIGQNIRYHGSVLNKRVF